mmetsp:Transcript_6559/g.16093  ORF Transcript_6559/g.16093 Transcript_6559/m.16093 type:complete len:348 (-) Transcript_6559:35-1078(-)
MEEPDFLPLNDDEIAFCWKALVDEGKLSVTKLQAFMKELCAVELSPVQAKDLLNYMDANGDGRVGMEDFKYFMSIGRLQDTDAQTFMWKPKAKFRADHGKAEVKERVEDLDGGTETSVGTRATANLFASPPRPPEPSPKAQATPNQFRRKFATNPSKEPADSGKKVEPRPDGPATMAKINNALTKYEQESWQKFLEQEEKFQRELFDQFASPGSDELTVLEYHKMLVKWYGLNSASAPGALRPGDSLASLKYLLRREQTEKDGQPHQDGDADKGSSKPSSPKVRQSAKASHAGARGEDRSAEKPGDTEVEPVLSYKLWQDVLRGKYQPDEHVTTQQPQVQRTTSTTH